MSYAKRTVWLDFLLISAMGRSALMGRLQGRHLAAEEPLPATFERLLLSKTGLQELMDTYDVSTKAEFYSLVESDRIRNKQIPSLQLAWQAIDQEGLVVSVSLTRTLQHVVGQASQVLIPTPNWGKPPCGVESL